MSGCAQHDGGEAIRGLYFSEDYPLRRAFAHNVRRKGARMTMEVTSRRITFRHRFALANMSEAHAPGTFDLLIEQTPLDVSWQAHRASCQLMLVDGGTTSAVAVTMTEIEAALLADNQHDINTGFS